MRHWGASSLWSVPRISHFRADDPGWTPSQQCGAFLRGASVQLSATAERGVVLIQLTDPVMCGKSPPLQTATRDGLGGWPLAGGATRRSPRIDGAPVPRRIRGSDYRWESHPLFHYCSSSSLDVGVIVLIVDREATEEPLHLPLQGAARRRAVEMVVAPGKRK